VNAVASLRREDWDFSEVPNEELIACSYWEYARESTFIRETLRDYRDHFQRGFGSDPENSDAIFLRMDRIQSIGDVSEVIIRGCSFPAGTVWQSVQPNAKNYQHPDADPVTGSFPAPWQTLSAAERACRSRTVNYGKRLVSAPFERAHWSEARDIANCCRNKADEIFAAHRRVLEENPGKSEVQLIQDGKLQPWPGIIPSLFWESGREVTVVRINWADYTNDDLVQHFRRWVKASRPKELPVPSRQGRKPGDWRARLTRLAVMRLLAQLTPSEIIADRGKLSSEVRESKQFQRRKWHDSTKWHDARREAAQIFSRMFPFLPPNERPRSWARQAPAKYHRICQVAR
jgi:hypothetical protein